MKIIKELATTKKEPSNIKGFGISPQIINPKVIAKTKLKYFMGVTSEASASQ